MPLKVKNTFIDVDEYLLQDEEQEGSVESIWQRSVTAPACTGPRRSQSLPTSPRLGSGPKVATSDTTSVEDTESKETGYDTPEEFVDEALSDPCNRQSSMDDLPPYLCTFAPEEMHDCGIGDPCAWQGWVVSGMLPFTVPCYEHEPDAGGPFSPECALEESGAPADWGSTVTAMMRNLPKKLTQHALLEEINSKGFAGTYDFVYLPMDIDSKVNRGYAFINFVDPAFAAAFKSCYEGRQLSKFSSRKVIAILPAVQQGYDANFAHFASARVTREDPCARPLFLRQPSAPVKALDALERPHRSGRAEGGAAKAATAASKSRHRAGLRAAGSCAAPAPDRSRSGPEDPALKEGSHHHKTSAEPVEFVVNFCPFCGGGVGKDFKFCQFCGSSLQL